MEKFFNPRSIAVIGASENEKKVGGMILENILRAGFDGSVFPVNPKGGKIRGLPVLATVGEIDQPVDLAIIALPAEKVAETVRQCGEKKEPISHIIIVSAGFSELGAKGREKEKEIAGWAQKYDLKIAGPNCLGMINPWKKLDASFVGAEARPGKIGLIMQSGAFVSAFLDWGKEFGLGFSSVATIGNKTFLDEVDFLEHFIKDERTEILGFYLESFTRGKEFCQAIKKSQNGKPVLILLAEGGKKTRTAALSHTASMAGQTEVAKNALEEAGALVFERPKDFLLALRYFSHFQLPAGNKILFLTNAGGPGVVAMGNAEKSRHCEIFELEKEQKETLKNILPTASSVANPVDLLGDADEERFSAALEKIGQFQNLGAAAVLLTRQKQTDQQKIFEKITQWQTITRFPIVPVFMSDKKKDRLLEEKTFSFFEEALVGLEAGIKYGSKIGKKEVLSIRQADAERQKKAKEIFLGARREGRSAFYYPESFLLGQLYGFNMTGSVALENFLAKEEFSYPVVLKVDDPNILHKEAQSGVVVGLENREELEKAAEGLRQIFPRKAFLVQPQQPAGLEIILGIKKDHSFGQVVLCGLGGILTEFLGEKMFFFPSQSKEEISRALKASRLGKILARKKIETDRLAEEVEKLFCLVGENEWIEDLDVNPLIVYADRDFVAVDFKVLF